MRLHEFQSRYEKTIQSLLAQIPGLVDERLLRPFWASRFLPGGSENILMLSEAIPASAPKIIGALAQTALSSFLAEYLAGLSIYAKQELGLSVTPEDLSSKEKTSQLRKKFKKTGLKDSVLSWILGEGLDIINEFLVGLHVHDLEGLAVLVSALDYMDVFIASGRDRVDPTFLFETLTGLKQEMIEAGLVNFASRMDELIKTQAMSGKTEGRSIEGQMNAGVLHDYGETKTAYGEIVAGPEQESAAGEEGHGGGRDSLALIHVA